jgi:hypothetical protein
MSITTAISSADHLRFAIATTAPGITLSIASSFAKA